MAGATAIEIGTANFINPQIGSEIVGGIRDYLDQHEYLKLTDFIGCLQV
jgi:dihydroorotate dehydrogenase (NAD+) catalytic subunit